jgi:hypothetical protein
VSEFFLYDSQNSFDPELSLGIVSMYFKLVKYLTIKLDGIRMGFLLARTMHIPIGTKYAAVTGFGAQDCATPSTGMKSLSI